MIRAVRVALLAGALIGGMAVPVLAHVGLEPGEVESGSSTNLAFRIGHGCEGQPTTSVSIRIPAGVASVSPFAKAGWKLEVETGALPEPITSGDQEITEGVTQVTWSGGSLDDGVTDEFRIRAAVHRAGGETVHFPVVQRCGDLEHAWIEIPAEGQDGDDLEEPAPSVIIAGEEGDGSSGTNPLTVLAIALSVTAIALSAAALAVARNGESAEEA